MAGYREFQTGEVLTAANVNDFLMEQSVMKFADSSARDTALGTAVGGSNALREGMVAYLDSTDEIQVYDGASWGGVGLPLGTATPTDGQILAFGTATSTWNPTDQLAGIGSNVKTGTITSVFTSTASAYTDTGLEATITLESATSSVLLVMYAPSLKTSTTAEIATLAFSNGASTLNAVVYSQTTEFNAVAMSFLDTPGSVGPHTYKVRASIGGGATLTMSSSASANAFIAAIEVSA